MLSREDKIEMQRRHTVIRGPIDLLLRDIDLDYTRDELAVLLKRFITDPAHRPYWNAESGHWIRPVTGHHHVAYAICRGKPWHHGLTHHSPRFLADYDPMVTLHHQCLEALVDLVAEDVASRVDIRLLTPLEQLELRDVVLHRAKHCIDALLRESLPNDREWSALRHAGSPEVRRYLEWIDTNIPRGRLIALVKQSLKQNAPSGLATGEHYVAYAILRGLPWHRGLMMPSPQFLPAYRYRHIMSRLRRHCIDYLHRLIHADLIKQHDVLALSNEADIQDARRLLHDKIQQTLSITAFVHDAIPDRLPPDFREKAYFSAPHDSG